MIPTKIEVTQIFIYVLQLNFDDERCLQKAMKVANFESLMFHHLKFQNMKAWGLTSKCPLNTRIPI